MFIEEWNLHNLSTQKSMSPINIWSVGMLANSSMLEDPSHHVDQEMYGVDGNNEVFEVETGNNVVVPEIRANLTEHILNEIFSAVPDPL